MNIISPRLSTQYDIDTYRAQISNTNCEEKKDTDLKNPNSEGVNHKINKRFLGALFTGGGLLGGINPGQT